MSHVVQLNSDISSFGKHLGNPIRESRPGSEALLLAYSFSLQRFILVLIQQCALTDLCSYDWWHLISALNTALYHKEVGRYCFE